MSRIPVWLRIFVSVVAVLGLFVFFPDVWSRFHGFLITLGVFELLRMSIQWLRFRKVTGFHTYGSMLFAVLVVAAYGEILVTGRAGSLMLAMLFVGVASNMDEIMITLILSEWRDDVPSWLHAMAIARGWRKQE